ncbi:MAG TPA: phosphohistidine phosphatase SixA [Pseudomonadales bacterium]
MKLYLLRHGEAETRAHNDPGRELTARGRSEVTDVAHRFAERNIQLQRCFVSPYVRAAQTAALFLSEAKQDVVAETTPVLMPEVRASNVMDFLEGVREQEVLLVSHNPLVSELHALLIDGDISHMHILGTSELICIEFDVIGLGMGRSPFRLIPEGRSWH